MCQIVQVTRSACGALHGPKVLQTAYAHSNAVRLPLDCSIGQFSVGAFRVESGDPLHDVESTQVGFQTEVPPLAEIFDRSGIEWELAIVEILAFGILGVQLSQSRSESAEILLTRVRDDIEILGRSDESMGVDGETTDDDVLYAALLQEAQQWDRVKRPGHA
ncbi:MAG TPA: hypothetical protein VIG42_03420 [Solirubrobacteraceae bacterium]|jgi:hypothetical protein